MTIMTVNGPINKKELGYCQCHEHLFIKEGKSKELNSALWLDDYNKTLEELRRYKNNGGVSLVDAQPLGSGRNTRYLIEAAKQTGLNIIASTGFHKLKYYPDNHWIFNISSKDFRKILTQEINNGMYVDTELNYPQRQLDAKAGIIKTAYSEEDEQKIPYYLKLLKAAALVALKTNRTIMCHTDKGVGALKVANLFLEEGLNPKSIIICHLDRKVDNFDYHYKVAEKGVYLDYDTIGRFKYHSDEREVELIKKMIDNGFEKQLLLALDTTRERMISYGGNIGLDYINKNFIPLLQKWDIKNSSIKNMTVNNPAEALDDK